MKSYADLVESARARITEVPMPQFNDWHPETRVLIDVREPAEWEQGVLTGAVCIPRGVLEGSIDSHEAFGDASAQARRETPVLLYCQSGARSVLAAERLQQMGFECVASLAGGFKESPESARVQP